MAMFSESSHRCALHSKMQVRDQNFCSGDNLIFRILLTYAHKKVYCYFHKIATKHKQYFYKSYWF